MECLSLKLVAVYWAGHITPDTAAMVAQLIASASSADNLSEVVVVEEGDDSSSVMTEINDRLGAYSKKVASSVAQKTAQVQPGMVIDISSMVNEANRSRLKEMLFTSSIEHMTMDDNASWIEQTLVFPGKLLVSMAAESEKGIRNNSLTGYFIGQSPRNMRDSANFDATIGSLFATLKAGKSAYGALNKAGDSTGGIDVYLKYKEGWTPAQIIESNVKCKALCDATTIVTKPNRSGTSASSRYKKAGNEVPLYYDVDHIIDLQLGGQDTTENMLPLYFSVNRSLGSQIYHKTKNLEEGTVINNFHIE